MVGVGQLHAVVANITRDVLIEVGLTGVDPSWTIVASVADAIVFNVGLVGVGDVLAVVLPVESAVAVFVTTRRFVVGIGRTGADVGICRRDTRHAEENSGTHAESRSKR